MVLQCKRVYIPYLEQEEIQAITAPSASTTSSNAMHFNECMRFCRDLEKISARKRCKTKAKQNRSYKLKRKPKNGTCSDTMSDQEVTPQIKTNVIHSGCSLLYTRGSDYLVHLLMTLYLLYYLFTLIMVVHPIPLIRCQQSCQDFSLAFCTY